MLLGKTGWAITAAAVVLGASFGVAFAQTQEENEKALEDADSTITGSQRGASVDTEIDLDLSLDEYKKRAGQAVNQIKTAKDQVRRSLSKAREEQDVVKTLCLQDKLNQMDAAHRSAEEKRTSIGTAPDAASAKVDYTLLQILRDRVKALVAEAQQCIGVETGFADESSVTVDIDPNIADPGSLFPDDPFVSTPPTVSSPDGS